MTCCGASTYYNYIIFAYTTTNYNLFKMNEIMVLDLVFETDDSIDENTDSSSSSSSSGEDDFENEYNISLNRRAVSNRVRTKQYIYTTIPGYTREEFKSHFRLYPETFEFVLSQIGKDIQETNYLPGRKPVPAREQLLVTIWIMATPDSYRSVSEKFDIDKATIIRAVRKVTHALYCIAYKFIKWPKGHVIQKVMENFERNSAFPRTIGAIDGTHIKINPPKNDVKSYINRKGYGSIQVQAVCTHDLLFTSVFAGYTGCVHDARVFRLSPVHNYIEDSNYFPENTHLVGDAAYGIHPNLMVPFKDNGHLSAKQKNYNFCLSSARVSIASFWAMEGKMAEVKR